MLISVSPHDSWFNLERVHRLDQLCRKLPAKLFDCKSLTPESRCKQIWTGNFLSKPYLTG